MFTLHDTNLITLDIISGHKFVLAPNLDVAIPYSRIDYRYVGSNIQSYLESWLKDSHIHTIRLSSNWNSINEDKPYENTCFNIEPLTFELFRKYSATIKANLNPNRVYWLANAWSCDKDSYMSDFIACLSSGALDYKHREESAFVLPIMLLNDTQEIIPDDFSYEELAAAIKRKEEKGLRQPDPKTATDQAKWPLYTSISAVDRRTI